MTHSEWLALSLLPLPMMVAPVLAADYFSVEQAQQQLFPHATQFVDAALNLSDEQRDRIKEQAGVRQRGATVRVWRAQHNAQFIGWFIVDEVVGKHEMITYATAIDGDGRVQGIEIMNYRETHGDQIRGQAWREQFRHKKITDTIKLGQDIANISGATLSCRNVTDGVRRLLVIHDLWLREKR